jgi:hypothetical protein
MAAAATDACRSFGELRRSDCDCKTMLLAFSLLKLRAVGCWRESATWRDLGRW